MFMKPGSIIATMLLLICCAGCPDQNPNQSETESLTKTETAADTGPKTFVEAAEQLVEMKNKIRDGFAVGDVDAAHGPLHQVGDLLENVATLAQQAEMPADQLAAVTQAKETLFDAFGEIDKTLHGGEGSTYEEEAEAIQSAMKVIVDAAGVKDDSQAPVVTSTDDGLPAGSEGAVDAGTVDSDAGDN